MTDEVFAKVKKILVNGLKVDEGTVTLEASISEDLGADSLDAVELIMQLEEEFGVEIEPAKAEGLKTVQDIVDAVVSLKG
ncbi:MAG: acyl carrier protein [Coriobacteriales bacterium]|nr:acyl carrier protein [Coriobacteriales bacterium]